MIEYKSLDKYEIKGRGTVFLVPAPFVFTDRSVLLGPAVIDGAERTVVSVEAFALVTIHQGMTIGLLVK